MKAVIKSFVLVLASGSLAVAQPARTVAVPPGAPLGTAEDEAVHRQFERTQAREKLDQARDAELHKDLVAAAKLYDEAWQMADDVGPLADAERQMAAAGIASVRMQLAHDAQRRGDYDDASRQVADVLRVDPRNQVALQFNTINNGYVEANRGLTVSPTALQRAKDIHQENIETSQLIQDGKLLYQLGRNDEAELKFQAALDRDPNNRSALYYLSLCKQQTARQVVDARNVTSMNRIVQVEKGWADNDARLKLPVPNPYAGTNMIYTSPQRQQIYEKLNSIVFDKIAFPNLQLSEVIRNLSEQTQRRDIDQQGINFILNKTKPPAAGSFATPGAVGAAPVAPPVATTFDPTTGAPIPAPGAGTTAEDVDLATVTISLDPGLRNVRLLDVLEAITKSADHPINYAIVDYGIEFTLKGPDQAQLHTRTFKVDPNTFYMGLQNVSTINFGAAATGGGGGGGGGGAGGGGANGGSGVTTIPRVDVTGSGNQGGGGGRGGGGGGQVQQINLAAGVPGAQAQAAAGGQQGRGLRYVTGLETTTEIQLAVIGFFNAVGVNLAAPKSVFFNDRQGTLTVRATDEDLELIEQAINTLNIAPPEVTIKSRFVEVNQNDNKQLGFDWYLGNFLMGNKSIAASGGSQPSFAGSPTIANPEGSFPGSVLGGTTIAPSTSDGLLSSGLRNNTQNSAPAIASISGILTDPQFRVVLHALDQRDGADLLNEGEVTTLSGRQANFQVVDVVTIITGASANATGGNVGTGPAGGIGGTVVQNQAAAINYPVDTEPYGTTLDVVPYVCADGYTIQMTLIPTITEFVGYDNPGNFVPTIQSGSGGIPITGQLPLPRSRVRQVVTSCTVWDGQTVVLGGLITENVQRQKDKIPVLGDLPGVGRLFRSEQNITQRKNLIIFVTPTIIDPSGNRKNLDDDMPFARAQIQTPPQTR